MQIPAFPTVLGVLLDTILDYNISLLSTALLANIVGQLLDCFKQVSY